MVQHLTALSLSLSLVPPQASRDLVCFLQLDHVNVYYGQDYRSKYKAPTDYCLALKVRLGRATPPNTPRCCYSFILSYVSSSG